MIRIGFKISLIVTLFFCSCKSSVKQTQVTVADPVLETSPGLNKNELLKLFEDPVNSKNTVQDVRRQFLFFQSGKFLNSEVQSALVITSSGDSLYHVFLYACPETQWILTDTLQVKANRTYFDIEYMDCDFDGQKDVLISDLGIRLPTQHVLLTGSEASSLRECRDFIGYGDIRAIPSLKKIHMHAAIAGENILGIGMGVYEAEWVNGELVVHPWTTTLQSNPNKIPSNP